MMYIGRVRSTVGCGSLAVIVFGSLACEPLDPAASEALQTACENDEGCVDEAPPGTVAIEDVLPVEEAFPGVQGDVQTGYLRTADGVLQVSARDLGTVVVIGGDVLVPADDFYANLYPTAEAALAGPNLPEEASAAAVLPLGQARWTGTIPYRIDDSLDDHDRVYDAIEHWEAKTPFRFAEVSSCSGACLVFVSDDGCWSFLGRQGSPQEISLQNGDCSTGTAIHEIGHALGFYHEHARTDRDSYVDILWGNIQSGQEDNFERYVDRGLAGIDLGPYDFGSIMHYGKTAFGTYWLFWQRTTIETHYGESIGQRNGLSVHDVGAGFLRWAPQVTVFRDRDYAGVYQTFPNPGEYRANRNELATVGNDQISSLVIPPGFEVTVCAHETAGPCETFRSSKTFVGTTLNDNISRVIIEDDPGPPNPGFCGCQNSGLGNICISAFDQCTDGFSPVCSPSQGSCGGCVCQ